MIIAAKVSQVAGLSIPSIGSTPITGSIGFAQVASRRRSDESVKQLS